MNESKYIFFGTGTRLFNRRVEVAVFVDAISVARQWKFYEISRKVY